MVTNNEQHDKYKAFLDTMFTMTADQHKLLYQHINTLMGGGSDANDAISKQAIAIMCSFPELVQEYFNSKDEVKNGMLALMKTAIQVGYLMHKTEIEGKL